MVEVRDFTINIWEETRRGSALMPLLVLAPSVTGLCGSVSHLSQGTSCCVWGLRLQGPDIQLMVGRMPCLPRESTRHPLTLEKWVTVVAKIRIIVYFCDDKIFFHSGGMFIMTFLCSFSVTL